MGSFQRLLLISIVVALFTTQQTLARGRFELRMPDVADVVSSPLTLNVCLKQYQTSVRVDGLCGIGSTEVSLQNASRIAIPFSLEWKEHYTLIVQVSEQSRVIDQLAKSDRLRPGDRWQSAATENGHTHFDYRIRCDEGYYGSDCMRRCHPVRNMVCSAEGIAQCAKGWRGPLCREPICENGCEHGRCMGPGKCLCSSGYEGDRCDRCIPMKGCVHGSCSTPFGCDCEPGWGGTNCNISTSMCTRTRPCRNGAICRPVGEVTFSCQCPPGFTGPTCATPLSACSGGNPCANGAECLPIGTFDFTCKCPEAWGGRLCDRPSPRQCQNGGFHTEGFGCRCPSGFSGEHCELSSSERKICVESQRGLVCRCAQGFEGENCEKKRRENPCGAENVCKNGGWCESNLDSFKCHCSRCFTGTDCSQRDPRCDENQQLQLIIVILGIIVLLVVVMLLLVVFLVRKKHPTTANSLRGHVPTKKESKIYSLPSEYASRYAADPCDRILSTNSRLREAAEKALREDAHYAEIDALSSV